MNELLSKLKLSTKLLAGYTRVCMSSVFPEYIICFQTTDAEAVLGVPADSITSAEVDASLLFSRLGCNNVTDFENALYINFTDKQDVLLRLALLVPSASTKDWTPLVLPEDLVPKEPTDSGTASIGVDFNPLDRPLSKSKTNTAPISLAEFDAVIDYLKTITPQDKGVRANVLSAFVFAMKDLDVAGSNAVDVLFNNLIISLMTVKNVDPLEARQFVARMMDTYIAIVDAEGR